MAVQASSRGLQVVVDGEAFEPDVGETAPGSFVLRREGSSVAFHCVREGSTIHLFWGGVAYRLEETVEGRAASRHVSGGLEAPMPGKVVAVKVLPGQTVARGDEVLVVEAMKMENAVRAPRDGTVKSVAVAVGEMVAPGVVLVELE